MKIKEYSIGDMVEKKVYIRNPKLRGIIIKNLGFDTYLDDVVYLIHCFSLSPPKEFEWKHKEIEKIS